MPRRPAVQRVNALEWDDPLNLKVDPCEGCGEPACAVGACVAVYRVHDDVVWLSAERWFEDYPADREAYWAPPAYLHRFGAVLFSRRGWDAVRAAAPHTPAVEALPELPDARLAELL